MHEPQERLQFRIFVLTFPLHLGKKANADIQTPEQVLQYTHFLV